MHKQPRKASQSDLIHVKGVKGHTVISKLPLLDLGTALLPEFMHSVLLGVVRQFISLWTEKKRSLKYTEAYRRDR